MNKLISVIQGLAVKMVLAQKDKIVSDLNKKIDLPFLSEKEEQELLEGIWSAIEDGIRSLLPGKKSGS